MAEDSGKAPQANQEVDLDNIEVEILIICKNAAQLNQAGSFLTRRGWPTTVITDLTKAIEHLADKKPDFVLVSFSHPSPRISKLPDLITTTFNLTCVGFVETTDSQSNAKLSNSKVRYKINGQASGPSIHRTVRKILGERFNIKTEEKSSSSERSQKDDSSGIVKVKGANNAANGPGVIMQKSSANATRDKGAQMVKGQASKMHESEENGPIGVSGSNDSGPEGYSGSDNSIELNEDDSQMVPTGGSSDSSGSGASGRGRSNRKSLKDLAGDSRSGSAEESGANGTSLTGKSLEDKKAKLKSLLAEVADGEEGSAEQNEAGANSSSGAGTGPGTLGAGFDGSDATKEKSGMSLAEAAAAATKKAADKAAERAAERAAEKAAVAAENDAKAAEAAARRAAEKESREAKDTKEPNYGGANAPNGKTAPIMQYDPIKSDAQAKMESEKLAELEKAKIAQEEKAKIEKAAKEKAQAEKAQKEKEEAELALKDPVRAAQSLMQKAVEAAMNRYCKTPPDSPPLPLEEITYVGVFPVESESVPGYLVVVWQAPDLSAREAFLRDCESEIRTAFGSMNVNGKLGTGFWTQLPAVAFVAWADNKANFHFMTAHQKREVGVAFFKTSSPLPKAQPAENGMYAVKLQDMSTEVAVNFKTYLYLKNNKKHFMYLRNGRKLQPEQKKRLLENQVPEVLIKSVDLENARQYLASGYLSGLIIEFNGSIAVVSQLTRKSS